jgi:hypothetical protein
MALFRWIFRNVLNSVPFGIATMVAIGLYIAVGSGWVGLREWLEMDELLFFNWWPLKLLIVLLVANLTVVTVVRIPFTPPRYGVWTIHMGIILLVSSLSAYYTFKTEGLMPLIKGRTTARYYDRWERALYVRSEFGTGTPVTLPGLPRFREYDESFGNAAYLDKPTMRNIEPQVTAIDVKTDQRSLVSLAQSLGVKDPITLDVIGYYPYATTERWKIDPAVNSTGLHVSNAEHPEQADWMVARQAAAAVIPIGEAVLEHRHVPTQADIDLSTGAAKRLHKLTITAGGLNETAFVEPGEEIEVGKTGYTIKVEGFTPQFPTFASGGKEKADTLTVLITHRDGVTNSSFRRTILSEKQPAEGMATQPTTPPAGVQTDFELNVEGAGPFGKRKREGLLDEKIQLKYAFNDPTKLLPTMQDSTVKYVLFTSDDTPGITMLRVSSREASVVNKADYKVDLTLTAPRPMFGGESGERELGKLVIERNDHVTVSSEIVPIPQGKRDSQAARAGVGQMVKVRVTCSDWHQDVPVPFDEFALEHSNWVSPKVRVPGATGEFQLMLGNAVLPLPIKVRLENFEPVPYAGGEANRQSFMRDFRSTISMIDTESGRSERATASLNSPAFYAMPSRVPFMPGMSWLFSQASWTPGDLDTTTLQVGNRPAVGMMVTACGMIFVGLMYAFYAKPFVIKAMKRNAIKAAQERKRPAYGSLSPAVGGES